MNQSAYGLWVQNRIERAKRFGNMWVIQKVAEKPVDGRCKNMLAKKIGKLWLFKIGEIDEYVKNGGAAEK